MSRVVSGGLIVAVSLAICTVPAKADVLEIGDDGARWVTGERLGLPVDGAVALAETANVTQLSADYTVPGAANTHPAEHSRGVPLAYVKTVQDLSRRFDLSPALIEALVWQESRWRHDAVSPVGARGLAQLMPATARELGVNPDDPFANLEGGARYLRQQLDTFDGNLELALAAYNAGPNRVLRAGGVPRIRETQHYVTAILGRLSNHSRSTN
ncbi:putative tape measure protein [Alteripontixanthobacter maritimus]|uniref:Putative tape measure protein n=1 Tax=Alteripontixanthobacter maritimus TaxID=2161824 RepID=A0A369Q7W5_9SPHN|nr:lytic transglycosylase domain-containing protein [Alteripontixanthobacter maritimus]RDC59377.1 putative tape measure protein [Alteripontixanthobacter maritimus]